MATFNKFSDFSEQLTKGTQNFGTDTYKVALSNSAPVNTNTVLADITQISSGTGYTSGGTATTVTVSESSGTTTVSGTQVVFTASGGSMGPFRYVVLYNDTTSSPNKPLVGWWDYGVGGVTLADTETFTIKFSNTSPGAIFTLT